MNSEYLLLNLLIISGPVALSFDRRVRFLHHWPQALAAITPVATLFLLWDVWVSGRHWSFNPSFTMDIRWFGLPPGEWFFFLSVPFALIFVWEVLRYYWPERFHPVESQIHWLSVLFFLLAPIAWAFDKEYTALMLLALAIAVAADRLLKTRVLHRSGTLWYFLLATLMMLIINGYLTARPVVLYQKQFQLGIRLFTIPLEDFGYGYALLLLTIVFYEKFRRSSL